MSRARIRKYNYYKDIKQKIEYIDDIELKKIAYMYFIEHRSQLDISFELELSDKTIYRRIKEIKEYLN